MRTVGLTFICILIILIGVWFYKESMMPSPIPDNPPPLTQIEVFHDVEQQPIQRKFSGLPFRFGEAIITPKYEFFVTARVLSKKKYADYGAAYAPIDLALGWGRMSKPEVIDGFKISQRNRWFYWRTDDMAMPRSEVVRSAANMHIIPSNPDINTQLKMIKEGQVVELSGKLVNLTDTENFRWVSSTTRNDTGNGACELFFVESLEIIEY